MDDGDLASRRSGSSQSAYMSDEEQADRRKQIRDIMRDPNLSQAEKNRSIQSLMDGRRGSASSGVGFPGSQSIGGSSQHDDSNNYATRMGAAAAAAAEYYSSDDDDDDDMMSDSDDADDASVTPGFGGGRSVGGYDDRSIASSVTSNFSYSDYYAQQPINPQLLQQQQQALFGPGAAAAAASGQDQTGMTYKQAHGRSLSLQDFNDNDRNAATIHTSSLFSDPAQVSRLMEQSRPPCTHYERNCTIISPCCGLAFGCRICHDECPVLPPIITSRSNNNNRGILSDVLDASKKNQQLQQMDRRQSMPANLGAFNDEDNHHLIDRFAIREVICRECCTRQSSKTNKCIKCGVRFGAYHCSICNLWMSNEEQPYHCEECGFCRVGGRENFKHCNDCGMCIDAMLFDDHNCKSGKYLSNCPICQEDLFSSREASHEMPCGHAIHWHCFKELTSYDTRCPVCKKTAEAPEQMAATWSAIAMGIALQPVPPDMARVVDIYCNDCEDHDVNRRWHFLGVRCMSCLSFNTTVERITMQGRDAAAFLDQFEAQQSTQTGVPTSIVASSMAPPAALYTTETTSASTDEGGGTAAMGGMMGMDAIASAVAEATAASMAANNNNSANNNNNSNRNNATSASSNAAMDEDVPSRQDTSSGSTDTGMHRF